MNTRFSRWLLGTLAAVMLFLLGASAQADGYVYRNGYYWYGGYPYTRTVTYYCSGSYCYPRYSYTRVANYTPNYNSNYSISSTTPGWRSQLLAIAAERDKIEGQMRLSANEHNEFMESVDALGLGGNFSWRGYGQAPGMAYVQRDYSQYGEYGDFQPAARQGSTVYQSSPFYSATADFYGAVDLGALYNQSHQLAQDAGKSGAEAREGHQRLVAQAQHGQQRLAQQLTKLEGLAKLAQVLESEPSAHISIESSGSATYRTELYDQAAPADDPRADTGSIRLTALVNQFCTSCHQPGKQAPDLTGDVTPFAGKIRHVLITTGTKRMPPPDSDPGQKLSDQQRLQMLMDLP